MPDLDRFLPPGPGTIPALLVTVGVAVAACQAEPPAPAPARARPAPPPMPARVAAIGSTAHLPVALQRAFDPAGDFAPLPAPGPDDWLAVHPAAPQSFASFLAADTRVPVAPRTVIYVLPLGAFPAAAPSVTALARIVAAFYTLEVRVLPAVPLAQVPAARRRSPVDGHAQLLAPEVLRWLTTRLPDDAFALMAVTMADLYPQASWNYVFGMASLDERVGVQSFARQDPAFVGEPPGPGGRARQLRRATWTMVHEVAHMFGLEHCTYWACVVAGANHQAEADARPLHLCPVCLRKLQASLGFDPAAREDAIAVVLDEVGIPDEAAWSRRRARWIREGVHGP